MSIRALVTDTHPLLHYFCNSKKKLSKKVRLAFEDAVIQQTTMIYVPAVVLWETSLLLQKGNVKLTMSFAEWVSKLFGYRTIISLPLDEKTVVECHHLKFHNDPFDQAIVAAALQLDLPLITNDRLIHHHQPCKVFWD